MSVTRAPVDTTPPSRRIRPRWQRGLLCWGSFLIGPFGWFTPVRFTRRMEPERLDQGLVIILPGIEGRSFFNLSILHGLLDAGVPYAMEIFDWTTGNKFLTLYHLRAWRRNQQIAQELAARIVEYQREHPGRPVWLIGHSGGGGISLLTAAALPEGHRLSGLILLAAAVSPRFDLSTALAKVERGIWSFHSWIDCLLVGLGTTVVGTIDGWHMPAAGMIGFWRRSKPEDRGTANQDEPVLVQTAYHPRMIKNFHLGGHFGCAHRVFVSEFLAPILFPANARQA
ncbi:MAG: alpha/beta hydrolase [Planctomycetaceae bacterium]